MAKAKQLPSGNWRIRPTYTDEDGVRHTASFTETTAKKAETKAALWQAGMLEMEERRKYPTLSEALEMYIETGRCTGMSPSTIKAYVAAQKVAYQQIADKRIDKLTVRDIQLWINARTKEVAPKTVKNNYSLLCTVLRTNGVRLDLGAFKLPQQKREEMEIPNDEQVAALLADVSARDDDMYIAIALAALMGLRRSEICALTWSDIIVDGETAYLSVDKALVVDEKGQNVEKQPKTRAGKRMLVIPPDLYTELKRRRHLRPTLVGLSLNAITERYMRVAQRLGVPPRFHNLRHYHASVMLREGVPEKYIVADMGHSSFEMVKRVYGHVMQEKRGEICAAMGLHTQNILQIATKLPRQEQKANNA